MLKLLTSQWRFLAFGLFLMFVSGFGQTYFIAIYSDVIQGQLGLSHGQYGLVYSLATLSSAVTLLWLGKKLDDFDLRRYTVFVFLGLGAATLVFSFAKHVVILWLGFYMLRLFGQGLLPHTATTSIARYIETNRGKALSITSFGHPISEIILPPVAVFLLTITTWQMTWRGFAVIILLGFLPIVVYLLKGHHDRHEAYVHSQNTASTQEGGLDSASRGEVLRDKRFYLLTPAMLAPPFLITGLFFYQVYIGNLKGWEKNVFALAFSTYAITTIIGSFMGGILIDKFGTKRLLPVYLIPFMASMYMLATRAEPWIIHAFMLGAGFTVGLSFAISGCIWPELYGTKHLGAIRSLMTSIMVLSTSAAPFIFGLAIDAGIHFSTIVITACIYCGGAALLAGIVRFPKLRLDST